MTGVMQLMRIERNVSSLAALVPFYCDALGFILIHTEDKTAKLKLGNQEIWLTETQGRPYPADSQSNDSWFQHFAIVTNDMPAAYARLIQYPHAAITQGGPQQLPPATGSVTAYKFRDPDGHPLELIYFPAANRPVGVDHSAIGVADVERSIAFYRDLLGFSLSARQTNQGMGQDRLDNLPQARVEIVALAPSMQRPPHLELLAYQNPRGHSALSLKPTDIAADCLIWAVDDLPAIFTRLNAAQYKIDKTGNDTALLKDPDGHHLVLHAIKTFVRRASLLSAFILLTACKPALLDPQGTIGAAEKSILIDSLAIMLAIVIPTIITTLGFAWWFRESNKRAIHLPDWQFSGRIEMIVWSIPAMVVILLGGVAWISAHMLDPYKPLPSKTPALEIQVVSLDWKWLFIYPTEHIASVNLLEIPAGAPVHFSLTSASVMSAFFVPQLGSMIYTMNGMVTQLNLDTGKPGIFYGLSSHYNGDGFSDMHFEVRAVPSAEFSAWVMASRQGGLHLGAESYASLSEQSMDVAPFTYSTVDPALFQAIVAQKLPPGPGPDISQQNSSLAAQKEQ